MKTEIPFLAFVEDAPSQAILCKIVESVNESGSASLCFREGFPRIMRGCGDLKKNLPACIGMGKNGLHSISLLDLDAAPCPPSLIRDWLKIPQDKKIDLPPATFVRIAVREVEAWIMADVKKFARFLKISETNLCQTPDELVDPKEFLFNLIRKKCKRKYYLRMLPGKNAHIGPDYNDNLCDFIEGHWSPERAAKLSPSLKRTMERLCSIVR